MLHRSRWILFLVLPYIGLALFSWIVTCYLSFRPITANHYGVRIWNNNNYDYDLSVHSLFVENERWYHAARVIQSIVSVLTIPLTSALCSSAAVIFIQQRQTRHGLTIRQVMTLADKRWTDLPTYARTFPFLAADGWKRYGSSFLLLAMFVNIIGSLISPLQEIFLSIKTIKTPTSPSRVSQLLDIPDQWSNVDQSNAYGEEAYHDSNLIVFRTRSALTSATNIEQQAQLWQGAGVSCTVIDGHYDLPQSCKFGGVTFANMSELTNPFLAELPSDYNTGLIKQFVPRINSSAQYIKIAAQEFPVGCDKIDGAFYVDYANVTDYYGTACTWGLQACMPHNVSQSPWKRTRDRQDFTEELYLNVTLFDCLNSGFGVPGQNNTFYKITLDTTAGYFELPNHMNGGSAGPLLDKDPNDLCGDDCVSEGVEEVRDEEVPLIYDHPNKASNKRRDLNIANDPSRPLEAVVNKGPLLTVAMAFFGEGSFIQVRQAYPQAYASNIDYVDETLTSLPINGGTCVDLAPLGFLLQGYLEDTFYENWGDYCITNESGGQNASDVNQEVASWIGNFNYDTERLTNAFTAAAFLANQAWMENNIDVYDKKLAISFDMGADTQIPVISRGGLIATSILLGVDILILLPLAIYASWSPRWTAQLDSFAMMRMGAAVADQVPLLVGREKGKIKALDEIPGWVGDKSEETESVGKLALGGPRSLALRKNRRFECYKGDIEPVLCYDKPEPKKAKSCEEMPTAQT